MGKRKAQCGIITAILVPILIVVLLASSFFAILDGIVDVVKGIVTAIAKAAQELANFFKDPGGWITTKWAQFNNWLRNSTGSGC